jgi:hypothetical protein
MPAVFAVSAPEAALDFKPLASGNGVTPAVEVFRHVVGMDELHPAPVPNLFER